MKKAIFVLLSIATAFAYFAGCSGGGGGTDEDKNPPPEVVVPLPCALFSSITGTIGGTDLTKASLAFDNTLFNESLEEVGIDQLYDYLGLDKNNSEDAKLFSYIFGNANYRLVIGHATGLRASLLFGANVQFKEELDLFAYDLNNYSIDSPIQIEDTSAIEQLFRDGKYKEAVKALVEMFRTFMKDGKINVVAGFNPDRSQDDLLVQDLINVFSPRTVQATGGTLELTNITLADGTVNNKVLNQPFKDISKIGGEFSVTFKDSSAEGKYCLPAKISSRE